jgi:CubicO group peptidase (beta-lactamase class C family)
MQISKIVTFLCFLSAVVAFTSLRAESATISKEQLIALERELASQLELNKIPGLSIAIVKDGEIAFVKGFGLMDIKKELPVTEDTVFPINSVSKPITSILAGIRVDEKAIEWDDLLSTYLPNFVFSTNKQTVPITLRDALSHRSGYGRNDTLWANPKTSREDILKSASFAIPLAKHRSEFHYNNVMYLAAGLASVHDRDYNWDSVLKEKLFTPLGMKSTTTNEIQLAELNKIATGYYWDDIDQEFVSLPNHNGFNVAPATGIYSNASDMANLLKLLLSGGKFEGERIIEATTLSTIFTPTIEISPTYSYALGWNVSVYNGETLLEHSGNGEGFSSQIALLPESGVGFILMMNVSISPLQSSSINLIFDILTSSDWDLKNEPANLDYSRFSGDYLANFWQFQNVHFTFKMHGGKPALNIPSQTLYMLNPPDKEGKFYFEVTNNVAISFILDDQNEVISMIHHEEGEQFVLPKKKLSEIPKEIEKPIFNEETKSIFGKINMNAQRSSYEELGTVTLRGSLFQEQSGVKGHFTLESNKLNWHLKQDLKPFANIATERLTNGGMNKRLRHQYQLKGYLHKQATREHPLNYLYWDKIYKQVSNAEEAHGKDSFVVSLEGFELSKASATIEESTGHIVEISMQFIDPVWGTYPRAISYFEYEQYCGLNIPRKFVINDHETGKTVFTVTAVKSDNCIH